MIVYKIKFAQSQPCNENLRVIWYLDSHPAYAFMKKELNWTMLSGKKVFLEKDDYIFTKPYGDWDLFSK